MQERKTKIDLSCTYVVCEEGAYSMFLTTLNSYKKKANCTKSNSTRKQAYSLR